jgi:sulfur transfer complex TusBCD TusB component (DsrH family)
LFLTQNAVLAARPSAQVPTLRTLIVSGVSVEADDFALRERGITKVLDGVKVVSIDKVVDHMESGHKTLWH